MTIPSYRLEATCGPARAGHLLLPHGEVPTPIFMPVGTVGSVKAMAVPELLGLGARIILGNTYHLWLRPGLDVIVGRGGQKRIVGRDEDEGDDGEKNSEQTEHAASSC
mgnify:CR=1 FL=1